MDSDDDDDWGDFAAAEPEAPGPSSPPPALEDDQHLKNEGSSSSDDEDDFGDFASGHSDPQAAVVKGIGKNHSKEGQEGREEEAKEEEKETESEESDDEEDFGGFESSSTNISLSTTQQLPEHVQELKSGDQASSKRIAGRTQDQGKADADLGASSGEVIGDLPGQVDGDRIAIEDSRATEDEVVQGSSAADTIESEIQTTESQSEGTNSEAVSSSVPGVEDPASLDVRDSEGSGATKEEDEDDNDDDDDEDDEDDDFGSFSSTRVSDGGLQEDEITTSAAPVDAELSQPVVTSNEDSEEKSKEEESSAKDMREEQEQGVDRREGVDPTPVRMGSASEREERTAENQSKPQTETERAELPLEPSANSNASTTQQTESGSDEDDFDAFASAGSFAAEEGGADMPIDETGPEKIPEGKGNGSADTTAISQSHQDVPIEKKLVEKEEEDEQEDEDEDEFNAFASAESDSIDSGALDDETKDGSSASAPSSSGTSTSTTSKDSLKISAKDSTGQGSDESDEDDFDAFTSAQESTEVGAESISTSEEPAEKEVSREAGEAEGEEEDEEEEFDAFASAMEAEDRKDCSTGDVRGGPTPQERPITTGSGGEGQDNDDGENDHDDDEEDAFDAFTSSRYGEEKKAEGRRQPGVDTEGKENQGPKEEEEDEEEEWAKFDSAPAVAPERNGSYSPSVPPPSSTLSSGSGVKAGGGDREGSQEEDDEEEWGEWEDASASTDAPGPDPVKVQPTFKGSMSDIARIWANPNSVEQQQALRQLARSILPVSRHGKGSPDMEQSFPGPQCPSCSQTIVQAARVCPFCGRSLDRSQSKFSWKVSKINQQLLSVLGLEAHAAHGKRRQKALSRSVSSTSASGESDAAFDSLPNSPRPKALRGLQAGGDSTAPVESLEDLASLFHSSGPIASEGTKGAMNAGAGAETGGQAEGAQSPRRDDISNAFLDGLFDEPSTASVPDGSTTEEKTGAAQGPVDAVAIAEEERRRKEDALMEKLEGLVSALPGISFLLVHDG